MEADFTWVDEFAERGKKSFMGNFQYIVNQPPLPSRELTTCVLNSGYLDSTSSLPNRSSWTMLFGRGSVSLTPIHLSLLLRSPQVITALSVGALIVAGIVTY